MFPASALQPSPVLRPTQLASPLPPAGTVPLAVGLTLLAGLAVGLVVRWRARRYYRDPESDAETAYNLRRLRHLGVLAGWGLAAVLAFALDTPTAARFALGGVLPEATATVLGPLAASLLPLVPVALAVRLATVPYRRAVRELRVRYRDAAAWELERDGVGLVVVFAGAAVIAMAPPGWPRALAAVGLGLVATALTPLALVVALRTRFPTDDERALVAGALDGRRLRIVDDRTRVGSAFAAGFVPGAQYVFLTESLFAVLDDQELAAVVAHEVGHHERDHVLLRFSLVALAAGVAFALVDVLPGQLALAAVAAGAVPFALGTAWVVRATERSADAYAAEAVGGPALASALETLAEHRIVVESAGALGVLSYHPSIAERVASLRGATAR